MLMFSRFKCLYINTSYGIILTDEMNEMALEFVDYLLEAEEEF